MAQARVALGAVLSTVSDTANAVSGIVNTISNSLDMANSFVRHQQTQQRFAQEADFIDFKERTIEELSIRIKDRKLAIAAICQDPEAADYYNQAYNKFSHLLEEKKA